MSGPLVVKDQWLIGGEPPKSRVADFAQPL